MRQGQEMLKQAGGRLTDSWHDDDYVRELDVSDCINRGKEYSRTLSVCTKTETDGDVRLRISSRCVERRGKDGQLPVYLPTLLCE